MATVVDSGRATTAANIHGKIFRHPPFACVPACHSRRYRRDCHFDLSGPIAILRHCILCHFSDGVDQVVGGTGGGTV